MHRGSGHTNQSGGLWLPLSASGGNEHRTLPLRGEAVKKEGREGNCSVLFQQDWFEILEWPAQPVRSTVYLMFFAYCCEESSWLDGHATKLLSMKGIHSPMRQKAMRSPWNSVVWNDGNMKGPKSLVEYLQIFKDKSATTLKIVSLIGYPFHVVLLNISENRVVGLEKMDTLWSIYCQSV